MIYTNSFDKHLSMFRQYIKIILAVAICHSTVRSAIAQSDHVIPAPDSLLVLNELPPLNIFIESALQKSPLLQASDRQIAQLFEQIKMEKKSWTDFVFFDANAKYGLYNQLTVTDIGSDGGDDVGISSNKEQLNYFVGISLRLPISKIANKHNELKILNESLEEKKSQKEEIRNQLSQLVIEEYYKLYYLHKSLKINQGMLQAFNVTLLKSERVLKSGVLSMEDYNSVLVQKGKIEDTYFKTQSEYYAQYKKLQILTGINIINAK